MAVVKHGEKRTGLATGSSKGSAFVLAKIWLTAAEGSMATDSAEVSDQKMMPEVFITQTIMADGDLAGSI